jgi:8-oxo-dGTP pyrophosphatase MutT (NUDIX family)
MTRRHRDKPQGETWGIPSGKLEVGEDPLTAVVREVAEEVGIVIDKRDVVDIGKLYVRHPEIDFVYHMFKARLTSLPDLLLALGETVDAEWLTVENALKLPLISGGGDALQYYRLTLGC